MRTTPLRAEQLRDQVSMSQPAPLEEPARVAIARRVDIAFPDEAPFARNALVAARDNVLELRMDIASIEQRYPLLRNAL
jgi:hypothetical protein